MEICFCVSLLAHEHVPNFYSESLHSTWHMVDMGQTLDELLAEARHYPWLCCFCGPASEAALLEKRSRRPVAERWTSTLFMFFFTEKPASI